jgi:simple sugar transport system permease protein
LSPLIAFLIALAINGVLLLSIGISPLAAYRAIYQGSLGSSYARVETLVKMAPLLLAGLGIVVAFRSRLFNIGAEGQLYMGAIFSAGAALFIGPFPPWIHIPLMVLAGIVGGALWALIPAVLTARFKVSETIVTLLLNYVAIEVVSYLVNGPWKDPQAVEPYTARFHPTATLPIVLPQTRLHAGILIALFAVAGVYFLMNHTVIGYRLRVAGANPEAARYGGISISRTIVVSLLLSGALAGLAGVGEVGGIWHRLMMDISPGYGYTAIVIALLGRLQPVGTLFSSFLFAALVVGADSMQRTVGAPAAAVLIVQALVILGVLASDYFIRGN